jgi:hypothetical protein
MTASMLTLLMLALLLAVALPLDPLSTIFHASSATEVGTASTKPQQDCAS